MSKQQIIVDALATVLGSIPGIVLATPDPTRPLTPKDIPAILILDEEVKEDLNTMDGGKLCSLEVRLVMVVDGTSTSAKAIRSYVESIYSALKTTTIMDGIVGYMAPSDRSFSMTQANKMVAAATVTLQIEYQTTTWEM